MPETKKKSVGLGSFMGKYFLLVAAVLVIAVFGILNNRFLQPANLLDILASAALLGILAYSAMVVMATGEMNFGIGAEATLVAAILGAILATGTFNFYILALLIALVAIIVVGCINSAVSVYIGVPAFIATLALSKINDGWINLLTGSKSLYSNNWPKAFTFLGAGYIGKIPVLAIVFVIITVIMWLLWDKSKLGRHIQAVGENPVACSQVGINVRRVKVIAFVITSLLAGFCGVLACSKTGNVTSTLGSNLMMNAMAVAMLSATFLRPGHFNIQGTIVGAILMASITNGITFLGLGSYWEDIIEGIILLISIGYIAINHKGGLPSVKMG